MEVVHIDVKKAIAAKMPRYAGCIPGFVYRYLAHVVRQDELNRILDENEGKSGAEFAAGVLDSLGIKLKVEGAGNIPSEGRFVFASNHPLGGLDGIALLSFFGRRYPGKVKCVVNDVLMAVEPLRELFLPINKYGSQARASMQAIDAAYSGDGQLVMFPAGLCSRMNEKGEVKDLEWQKSFISKSIETRRDIIPVYFGGENSRFFYKFARNRKRLGIKFNVELIFLPGEMVDARGSAFTVRIGKPIPYASLDGTRTRSEWAQWVKDAVYGLSAE